MQTGDTCNIPCRPGTYKPSAGPQQCIPCPAGSFSDGEAWTACALWCAAARAREGPSPAPSPPLCARVCSWGGLACYSLLLDGHSCGCGLPVRFLQPPRRVRHRGGPFLAPVLRTLPRGVLLSRPWRCEPDAAPIHLQVDGLWWCTGMGSRLCWPLRRAPTPRWLVCRCTSAWKQDCKRAVFVHRDCVFRKGTYSVGGAIECSTCKVGFWSGGPGSKDEYCSGACAVRHLPRTPRAPKAG
jgi:hypothetical protein